MTPVAPRLWTDEPEPQLIGGRRKSDGEVVFPMPEGDAEELYDPIPLGNSGTLWSWTVQRFEPKRPPYEGPLPFAPFALGYVALPEVIVQTRLDADPDMLAIGMRMRLAILPFTADRTTFAFRPIA